MIEKQNGGRKCKTCACEKREWIDQQLAEGKAFVWLSSALQDMGIEISKSAIWRHEQYCLGGANKPEPPVKKRRRAAKKEAIRRMYALRRESSTPAA